MRERSWSERQGRQFEHGSAGDARSVWSTPKRAGWGLSYAGIQSHAMPLLPSSPHNRQRLVVYSALAVVVVGLLISTTLARRHQASGLESNWMRHDWEAEPSVQLLRDYVRIDTSEKTGNELAGARWLADRLAEAGVRAHVEQLGQRHANLWAILPGENPRALVLHSHIDVADIEHPELWKHPPFEAAYDPPWVFGRGVFDMKSVTIAQLMAFIHLKKSGRPLRRTVILLATAGEEAGHSELGVRWLLREHPELSSRFWTVLTEGGIVEASSLDRIKYWGIEFAQKQFADGVACAASEERLQDLHDDLVERLHPSSPLRVPKETRIALASYAGSRTYPRLTRLMSRPDAVACDLEAFRTLPEYIQSMFRDELVPFPVEKDPAGGFELPFKVHLLPGSSLEEALARLLPRWLTTGTSVSVAPALGASHGSPVDSPVMAALQATIRSEFPGVDVGPYLVPWSATDSRFFREAGIPSYGFSPFLILSTDTYDVDGVNERMAMPGFVRGVRLYRDAVQRIAN